MPIRHVVAALSLLSVAVEPLYAQHQTATFSPVLSDQYLPYDVEIVRFDIGTLPMPTLHSYAKAQWDGKWLLVGGRTNGLHGFSKDGIRNFPPAYQNRDVWVIDPQNGQSWSRSLDDPSSGLSTSEVDSLAVTNNQFYQTNNRLYLTGGYGLLTDVDFVTFDTLTAIDVPELMSWVQGSEESASKTIRQIHDPLFTVTGGAMLAIGERTHLVFGQEFQGEYRFGSNGVYTNQVRSFTIYDDGENLAVEDVAVSTPDTSYRRRDLNVVPIIHSTDGQLADGLVALSGVFTTADGAWTVPVEIDGSGTPHMADPSDLDSFKQAMGTYHSAKLGMYSADADEMHTVLFGGISLHTVDRDTGNLVRDDQMPFVNQNTAVVRDRDGRYTQHLLANDFPQLYDGESGLRLHFGTNAEFMVSRDIATYDNGVIQLDAIDGATTVGYILGGLTADMPNGGKTAASGEIFEVIVRPKTVVRGDLDVNGLVDVNDINLLIARLNQSEWAIPFDLDRSGGVDQRDLGFLVETVLQTWTGDANLDGEFNSADLVAVFQVGQYEDAALDNSTWQTGDWNGDKEFDSSDFVLAFQAGGYEAGPRAASVPEPRRLAIQLPAMAVAFMRRIRVNLGRAAPRDDPS